MRAGLQTSIEDCRSAAGCVTATPVRECSCELRCSKLVWLAGKVFALLRG